MKTLKHIWWAVLAILLIIATSLSIWFIFDVRNLYTTGMLRPTRSFRNHFIKQTLSPEQIQGWMTFSYVNYIFNLPPNYLSESLVINDPHYPNVEIRQYAKTNVLDETNLLYNIQQSVTKYINGNP